MPYPQIEPYGTRRLAVTPPHLLLIEECGNPAGVPVVVLHGGPGSGCRPLQRRLFDPGFYRIVLLDQRGCGRSEPRGSLLLNRTPDLIDDLEQIRCALGIDRWLLFGGSWGATLALLYAQAHPAAVSGLVLRGVFLARPRDLDWFFGADGVARVFPEDWQAFSRMVALEGSGDAAGARLISAYHREIQGPDRVRAQACAQAWCAWEDRVATWTLSGDAAPSGDGAAQADCGERGSGKADSGEAEAADRGLAKARIATHYAHHRYFITPNEVLRGATRLPEVPISIVHGRRDLVCPLEGAWALRRAIARSRLLVVPEAGHLDSEPGIIDALVGETDRMRDLLG